MSNVRLRAQRPPGGDALPTLADAIEDLEVDLSSLAPPRLPSLSEDDHTLEYTCGLGLDDEADRDAQSLTEIELEALRKAIAGGRHEVFPSAPVEAGAPKRPSRGGSRGGSYVEMTVIGIVLIVAAFVLLGIARW